VRVSNGRSLIHDVSFDDAEREYWRANIGTCWLCPVDYFFVAMLNLVNTHALDPLSVVGGRPMSNTNIRRVPARQTQLPSDASSISILKARQCAKIAEFRQALIASGFDSVDAQAAVLGLSRSSTWMILNRNHKASGLSCSVINRIMRSTRLPSAARGKLEEYVQEKLMGKYGHRRQCLRRFRDQLSTFPEPAMGSLQRSDPNERNARQTVNYGQRVATS
jgi:hypothetical protein